MTDIKGPHLLEAQHLSNPTVNESSVGPRHVLKFAAALTIFGGFESLFGIISASLGSVEAIMLGGSNSFFAGPVLGITAMAAGVAVFIVGRKSTTPKTIKSLLVAVVVLGLLIAVACVVVCLYTCTAASQINTDDSQPTVSTVTSSRPRRPEEDRTSPKKIVSLANDASDITNPSTTKAVLIASAVFYVLLAIAALFTSVIASINICCVPKSSVF